jgi:mRNA interferase MazF
MKTTELKLSRIGNSRGVRIPADTLKRYGMDASVMMDELADGILLRSGPVSAARLTWEETAREMATSGEDWSEWDAVAADGLEAMPWEAGHGNLTVAEQVPSYGSDRRQRKPWKYKRYDLCWAVLDPVKGAEMAKTRPVVIVSLDLLNARLQTITVCPLTTQLHPRWRTRLQVRCGGTPSEIAVDQIRTISRSRLGERIDRLSDADATALRRLITELYGE